jgi:hypothetical protein
MRRVLCMVSVVFFSLTLMFSCATVKYNPTVDPADFVDRIDHPYIPMIPGTAYVIEGISDEGRERIEIMVTGETREVMGVTCIVVRDTAYVEGEMIEDTYDWYAQDRHGNVWYFGEDSGEYKDNVRISSHGSWEAGVGGALPGIVMPAELVPGQEFRQEYWKGEAEDMVRIISLDNRLDVEYGSFTRVLKTLEWNPLEPDSMEYKYYAEKVGLIKETSRDGSEYAELISMSRE